MDVEPTPESEDEHARKMDEHPNKLHDEPDPPSIPYVRKTGKMSKKETIEQTSKNKSILDWASKESNIPGLRDAEEDDIGRCGWSGNRDMPEEVRRARTTGGTIQLQKSQEVKDGPDGRIETDAETNMMTDYGRSRNLRVDENDPFDRLANDDIDCIMRMIIDPNKYDPEDSLEIICLSMMKK